MKTTTLKVLMLAAGSMVAGAAIVAHSAGPGASPARPAAATAAPAVDPAKVVLSVGDSKMTAAEFNDFLAGLPPEIQEEAKGPQKRRIAEDLVKVKLLAAEAKRQKLDETQKFKRVMEMMRENALAGALFADIQDKLVSDDDVKKYYDENKNLPQYDRATVRHILVPAGGERGLTDEQARSKALELKAKLVASKGADFAAIAKAESADPGSKDDGGELPAFARGTMLPTFEEAAFKQPVDVIGEPVKTRYGYHIIQVLKRGITPVEDVKPQIVDTLRPQKLEAMIEGLRKNSKSELDEAFFGPAAVAPQAPGAGATGQPPVKADR